MRPIELFLSRVETDGREFVLFLTHDLKTIRARCAAFEVKQFYRGGRPHEERFEVLSGICSAATR